jgi:hypothetical protein
MTESQRTGTPSHFRGAETVEDEPMERPDDGITSESGNPIAREPVGERVEYVAHYLRELAAGLAARGDHGTADALLRHRRVLLGVLLDGHGATVARGEW